MSKPRFLPSTLQFFLAFGVAYAFAAVGPAWGQPPHRGSERRGAGSSGRPTVHWRQAMCRLSFRTVHEMESH